LEEVCGFACGISAALFAAGCKAVVMACNISSAVALDTMQEAHPDSPVLGVILPGARAAAAQTLRRRVGVLATEGTVRSGAYVRALHAADPSLAVTQVACPRFVPLVEAGETETPEAVAAAQEYLAPLREANADVAILGCTHYPFLLPTLQRLAPELIFVDPAEQTAQTLVTLLHERRLNRPHPQSLSHALRLPGASADAPSAGEGNRFASNLSQVAGEGSDAGLPPFTLYTTGEVAEFSAQARRFLTDSRSFSVLPAVWHGSGLRLASRPALVETR
jgi:glutamate racemase